MRKLSIVVLIGLASLLSCKKSEQQVTTGTTRSRALTSGTIYYIDPSGNDGNTGTSPTAAWKTLAKVNATTFVPGDQILFKSGGIWNDTLHIRNSGTQGAPIIIDKYGGNALPVINGGGKVNGSNAVLLDKVSYFEVNNLEVTNTVPAGVTYAATGIRVTGGSPANNAVVNIAIKNCYVHNVNAAVNGQANFDKGTGGIILDGKIYGGLVQSCRVSNSSVEGIRTTGSRAIPDRAKNIVIDNNLVENIYGDGIVISGVTGGSKAINNTVYKACSNTSEDNYAGIWTIGSINTLVAHNEVYGMTGGGANDGTAFDADGYDAETVTDGDIFEYNYSHDNNGGFMLFMKSSKNITVRYNVSVNDVGTTRQRKVFLTQASSNTSRYIYNNVFYLKNLVDKVFWGPAIGQFSNNIFYAVSAVTRLSDVTITNQGKFFNNCFYPAAAFSSLNWGTSVRSNNFYDNPSFVNPVPGNGFSAAGGYNVNAASPCRNAGIFINNNGGQDFSGNALPTGNPDAGAFQHAVIAQAGSSLDDAYVRNGTYANDNYGTDSLLSVKSDAGSYTRKAYLKFDFTPISALKVSTAKLNVYVNSSRTTSDINVYSTATKSWLENTLTWNNAPMDTTLVGKVTINGAGTYSIDVTSAVNRELLAGSKKISLLLLNPGPFNSIGDVSFRSKEATTSQPVLQLQY